MMTARAALTKRWLPAVSSMQAQWNAEQRRKHQPARAAQMDLLPVLRNDDGGNSDGNKHRQRGSDVNRKAKGEQRNSDQRLAKSKDGANQRGDKNDQ